MSLADIASIAGLVSGVAVLASVLLLYFQLRQLTEQVRQSERNQQALIRQGKTDRIVSILMSGTEPSFGEVLSKIDRNDKLSPGQLAQYQMYLSAHFANFEDIFYQHRDGLITESAYVAPNRGFRWLMSSPSVRQFWSAARALYPDEFVAFVDSLIVAE